MKSNIYLLGKRKEAPARKLSCATLVRKVAAHSIEQVLRFSSVNYVTRQGTNNLPFYKAYLHDVWLFFILTSSSDLSLVLYLTSFLYLVLKLFVFSLSVCVRKIKVNKLVL